MFSCNICYSFHSQDAKDLPLSPEVITLSNKIDTLKDLVVYYTRDVEERVNLFSRFIRESSLETTNIPYQVSIQRIKFECSNILTIMHYETTKFRNCKMYKIQNVARVHETLFAKITILGRDIETLFIQFFRHLNPMTERNNNIEDDVVGTPLYRPLLKSLQIKKKDVNLIEDLECKICYDTTDINKRCILNCSHTLCIDCVISHINSTDERQSTARQSTARQSTAATHYSCPICRANIMEIMANYVVSRSKKEDKSFSKKDLTSSESYKELQTKCNV